VRGDGGGWAQPRGVAGASGVGCMKRQRGIMDQGSVRWEIILLGFCDFASGVCMAILDVALCHGVGDA
jgi:hypothetical protein